MPACMRRHDAQRLHAMKPTRPKSIAEREAEARKNSVLLRFAYHATPTKGRMLPRQYRHVSPELLAIFEELVAAAAKYKQLTGRHLPILGELGELFAEIVFGVRRHAPMTQGSDGQIGNDLVEVKTITPDKKTDLVQVTRAGGFVNLIVVKITEEFQFGARMVHRRVLKTGKGEFDEVEWADMIAGEPDPDIHRNFPIKPAAPKRKERDAEANWEISNYLALVHQDWESSRSQFPINTFPPSQWPIPFFGNPRTALVATVGVNPSSGEFKPEREWGDVESVKDWKERLRDYFQLRPPQSAHRWFEPWRAGLKLLGVSYEAGTASHLDVSYRATTAMLKNPNTDAEEFRRMVERDVAWFFKLLLLCPNLRVLLTFGPVVRADSITESLTQFLKSHAPHHGFSFSSDGNGWAVRHTGTGRIIHVHEADQRDGTSVTSRVVENLRIHGQDLRQRITLQKSDLRAQSWLMARALTP